MQSLVLIPRGASFALTTLWGNPAPRRVGVGVRSLEREHCPSVRIDKWAWAKRRSASLTASAEAVPGPSAGSEEAEKILVLGGSGFVGSKVCEILTEKGYQVVSISRSKPRVSAEWIKGDLASDPGLSGQVLKVGGFSGVVHAVGMLLPNDWNALASGSGSKPSPGSTYDQVTRSTAVEAARALAESDTKRNCPPFVFVSAAEAGWDPGAPLVPPFLQEYLAAKRAVEEELLERQGAEGRLRPVILRPSLIWTPDRPLALPAVTAFAIGSAVGVPGVERPVRLETLAAAAVAALADDSVRGVLKRQEMEALAAGQPDAPTVQQ